MSPWILRESRNAEARLRLFMFPYSGAGASVWRQWPDALAPQIDVVTVQLPGRETRLREPPANHFDMVLPSINALIDERHDLPFALMGHSMGAHLAFAVMVSRAEQHKTLPAHVILSGRRPVHIGEQPTLSHLPDEQFLDVIRSRHGSAELDEGLMRFMLPTLKADLQMTESWRVPEVRQYPVLATVIGALDDDWVPSNTLGRWYDYFQNEEEPRLFKGDHFFLLHAVDTLSAYVRNELLASLKKPQVARIGSNASKIG